MEDIIKEVLSNHFPAPPLPEDTRSEIVRTFAEQLPSDVLYFYTMCNGARLFSRTNSRYEVLGMDRLRRTRIDIYGVDDDDHGPSSLYSICDTGDGDYVALDLGRIGGVNRDLCPVIDCFHETFADAEPPKEVIANSFTEFLTRALSSDNKRYWIER